MANTYTLIASSTVGSGGAANIEFTSIPSTYTDLYILASVRSTRTGNVGNAVLVSFNNSTSNLSYRTLEANGSSAYSYSGTDGYLMDINAGNTTSSTFSNISLYIPNYNSSNNKSYSFDGVMENNATLAYSDLNAGLWSDSAAITSVKLTPNGFNFVESSTAYLYGISNS